MATKDPVVLMKWAMALTDERLSEDLLRLAGDIRWCSKEQREAELIEAAVRLAEKT